MDAAQIIAAARKQGRRALSEYTAKQVLGNYGIPTAREVLAEYSAQAVTAARDIGYPVVLKACSATLMHKSEKGLVALGITDDAAVETACERSFREAGEELEGILVQEMVSGNRELVVGMNRDPQFGPCVMLGLGGVMTEIFRDTVFRMAPIDATEAADMADQLKSKKIFDAFRGERPADRPALYRCLTAVGQIALDHETVSEIDINPVIITKEGEVTAVDALIVLA